MQLLVSCFLVLFSLLVVVPSNADSLTVFDIPRADNITIDGKAGDWGDSGFRVDALLSPDGRTGPNGLDVRFRLAWNDTGLLMLATVRGDSAIESDDPVTLWQKDSLELYLVNSLGGDDMFQAVIAPGTDPKQPELRSYIYDYRKNESLKKVAIDVKAARTKTGNGYVMEAMLPWRALGITPKLGTKAAFQFVVNDFDPHSGLLNLSWYPALGTHADTSKAHILRLANKASAPVLAAGRGWYDRLRCTRATIVGAPELAGKMASVRANGTDIAHSTLILRSGRAVADMRAAIPAPSAGFDSMQILLDGSVVDTVTMPDLSQLRDKTMYRMNFRFHPFCFFGSRLPDGDFEDPNEAENVFGPYTLNISYYDSECNPVTEAEKPGRYSAIVEIKPQTGEAVKRFYTLFRFAGNVDLAKADVPVDITFPKELGLDPTVMKEQSKTVSSFIKQQIIDSVDRTPDSATTLAWLNEVGHTAPATDRTGPTAFNNKWLYRLKQKTGNAVPLKYHIMMPQGASDAAGKKFPTIIFLHGAGSQGMDADLLAKESIPTYMNAHKDLPFIVISPRCPAGGWWNNEIPDLDAFYSEMLAKYPVDPDRVYLTGLSMGGFGSWRWATEHPERFACVVPICGGGDTADVAQLKNIPIWVFHGGKDPTVPVQYSYDMVDALKKIGGRVKLTIFPEAGHNSWDQAYNMDTLYTWMLQQVRGKPDQPRAQAGDVH